MTGRIEGRSVVITGAGSGLGRASALRFAAEGASVVVGDLNTERADAVAAEITAAGGAATAVTSDVSREEDVERLVAVAVETYGKLDVMFNNAGIPSPTLPIDELRSEDFRRLLDVNVMGVFHGCKAAVPYLKENGGGVILNTSSAAALVALPNLQIYAATKGAINALTRDLAVELGPFGIRVNALCSMGGMSANFMLGTDSKVVDQDALQSDWDPSKSIYALTLDRPPSLRDHAAAALFLVSDDAAWCSGVCLPVDGATTGKGAVDVNRVLANYAKGADD